MGHTNVNTVVLSAEELLCAAKVSGGPGGVPDLSCMIGAPAARREWLIIGIAQIVINACKAHPTIGSPMELAEHVRRVVAESPEALEQRTEAGLIVPAGSMQL